MSKYLVGLVGEQNYQAAVSGCRPGEKVLVLHEVGNPFDDFALRVDRQDGSTIGYVPKDNWLKDAVHHSGAGVIAHIKSINGDVGQSKGVVIQVELTSSSVHQRPYRKSPQTARSHQSNASGSGEFGSFIKGLIKAFRR